MINLSPTFDDIALRKVAMFGSSNLGNDIYYMKEFLDILINIIGEERLIDMLKKDKSPNAIVNNRIGKNWNKNNGMKRKLKKFDLIIEKTKSSYDILEDKKLNEKKMNFNNFIQKCKEVPLIKQDIYALFVFMINNTSLKNRIPKSEYWKILEYKGSRVSENNPKDSINKTNINKNG